VRLAGPADRVVERLCADGIVPGIAIARYGLGHDNDLLITVTETLTDHDFDRLAQALA